MPNDYEPRYWVGFSLVPGIGPAKTRRLLDSLGSLGEAWHAEPGALARAGLDSRSIQALLTARKSLDLDQQLERLWKAGVQVLTWESAGYPKRLLTVDSAPPVLYVRGEISEQDDFALAVVGTRRATAYGREAAHRLSRELGQHGLTVVSGLARGIDTAAHRGALEAGGRTLAVLGSGVDVIYPAENRRLAEEIAERGAIVSEYALGTQPEAANFPPRNRIISGLSTGVLVVEAGLRSGALITVAFAADQGRDVFAVPGSIFSRASDGANDLIRQGAKLVRGLGDILEELNLERVEEHIEARQLLPADDTEAALLRCLSAEPLHIDEIRREAGLPIAMVSSTLALMELKGLVRQVSSMHYVLG